MDVSAKVVTGYLGGARSCGASGMYDSLTHREREVLKLVAEGNSNKFIAEFLSLSVKTVEKHRSNLMSKLDLHNARSDDVRHRKRTGCPIIRRAPVSIGPCVHVRRAGAGTTKGTHGVPRRVCSS
jgi:DNA-binding NarL/FixJ family response regulator